MLTSSPLSSISDQEFTQLIENKDLHDKLYRYAFTLYHNKEDAKDLLQEVLMKLWHNRDKFT